jgi:hypothetical protein
METAAEADRIFLRTAGIDFVFATSFFFTRVFIPIEIPLLG